MKSLRKVDLFDNMNDDKLASYLNQTPLIFCLNKPVGLTSSKFLSNFKRLLPRGVKKIGHFGTLDPFADGLLMVGVGGSMKLMNLFHEFLPKSYKAKGILGQWTLTGDLEDGVEIFRDENFDYKSWESSRSPQWADQVRKKFIGEYWQSPPFYSATKFKGKPLYEWARKEGTHVQKEPVKRFVHELNISYLGEGNLEVDTMVSTGTYIRVLFDDIAKELKTRGVLNRLCRYQVGSLKLEDTIDLEDIEYSLSLGKISSLALCPSQLFDFKNILLEDSSLLKSFLNGHPLLLDIASEAEGLDSFHQRSCFGDLVWLKAKDLSQGCDKLLGLAQVGEITAQGSLRLLPQVIFAGAQKTFLGI